MPITEFHAHPSTGLYKGLIAEIDTLGANDRFACDNFSPPRTPTWSTAAVHPLGTRAAHRTFIRPA